MRFEWDTGKSEINLKRHMVSFEEAVAAFFDSDAVGRLRSGTFDLRAEIQSYRIIGSPAAVCCVHRTRRKLDSDRFGTQSGKEAPEDL